MKSISTSILEVIGLLAVVWGVARIDTTAAIIVAGLITVALSVLIDLYSDQKKTPAKDKPRTRQPKQTKQ